MAGLAGTPTPAVIPPPAVMPPPQDPFAFAQQSALNAMGAPQPGAINPMLHMQGAMSQGMGTMDAGMMQAAAQQLAAQGIPPPAPGSLQQLMKDPRLMQMMMGAVQSVDNSDEDLARLRIAAGKGGAYVNLSPQGGQQFAPTIAPLYAQSAKRRGRAPGLGESLKGGE